MESQEKGGLQVPCRHHRACPVDHGKHRMLNQPYRGITMITVSEYEGMIWFSEGSALRDEALVHT